jgi:putative transposase
MAERKKESPEYLAMRDLALTQLRSGKSLTGEGGVFAPIVKEFLESALSAEMEDHLDEEERSYGNKRNGRSSKTLKTSSGQVTIDTPQDRHSTFNPQIVKKRETILADNLAPQIIGLYGKGMSLRDITSHIKEMYNVEISAMTLSEITDRVIPQVKEWQNRPLDEVYPIVWLDAMHYKVRDGGKVVSRAVYNILAINKEGRKELIGMYISESEGANFWLSILTDLKNRGVNDVLIACTDNLKGFSEAILSVFPETEIQKCVIHQIRNSLKYVASKDQKLFMKDLKKVYQSPTKSQAETELLNLEEIWGKKYPIVIRSWNENWDELTTYFDYDTHIRKLIYTTNPVEGFHRQVRKVTKTKGAFPSDMALLKLIYLATENISKKWTQPLHNWGLTIQQLCIKFGDRMKIEL